jgi:putative exporter of polyketide antibiotics
LGLSEEAKLEYLREKIKQTKRSGTIYIVLSIAGLVGLLIGFIDWAFDLIIMGVALFLISFVLGFHSNKRKNDLMEQLRRMGYEEEKK